MSSDSGDPESGSAKPEFFGMFAGRSLGHWKLSRLIGEGSFGAVYEAEHTDIPGRRAAVKILHPMLSVHEQIKQRFINEASAASRAEHENIVQVFDGGITADGLCYSVMELLSGVSVYDLLDAGPLGLARTLNIGIQVASALAAAHDLGIVHRDLKPENIFVTRRASNPEFVKVLDFGIAKLRQEFSGGSDDERLTRTGMLMGTPPYMAPEQWMTLPDIDGRADVYALGAILFECLTGKSPFIGGTPYEWQKAHLEQPVRPLTPEEGPQALSEILQGMLAKERGQRYATMHLVAQALIGLVPAQSVSPSQAGGPAVMALQSSGAHALVGRPSGQRPLVSAAGDTRPMPALPTIISPTPPPLAPVEAGAVSAPQKIIANEAPRPLLRRLAARVGWPGFAIAGFAVLLAGGVHLRNERRAAELDRLVADADKALANLDWNTALDRYERALVIDPLRPDLHLKKGTAEREKKNQGLYEDYVRLVENGDREAALSRAALMPDASIYRKKIDATLPTVRQSFVGEHLAAADEARGANRCDRARPHLEAVLHLEPQNEAAARALRQCATSEAPASRKHDAPGRPDHADRAERGTAPSDLRAGLAPLSAKLRACPRPNGGGTADLLLVIAPTGRVQAASVSGLPPGSATGSCLTAAAMQASFKPFTGASVARHFLYSFDKPSH